MLIPSIDLLGGRIVQLVQGEKLRLAFDDFEYWIGRFSRFPLVQLIDRLIGGDHRGQIGRIAMVQNLKELFARPLGAALSAQIVEDQ